MVYQKSPAQSWFFHFKNGRKSFQLQKIFLFIVLSLSGFIGLAQRDATIRLNQVGYYPNGTKLAIVTGKIRNGDFYIVSADGKDTVYEGTLTNEKRSAYSSASTREADFSEFQKCGNYILRIQGAQSFPFEIKNEVYTDLSKAILKSFYYQRSSITLEEKYAGKWTRSAKQSGNFIIIHPSDFMDSRGVVIASRGGWYEADGQNKCILSSGLATARLLSAYEDFSNHFDTLQTNIPESGNNVPDLLNEIVFNLRWMLTMQDPFDGGIYNQCSGANYDSKEIDITKTSQLAARKSTAAALDFAAVMAQAGRVLKAVNAKLPQFADSCLKASVNAWYWALKNPNVKCGEQRADRDYKPATNVDNIDDELQNEWTWAATEMFVTSKNKMYFDVITQNDDDSINAFSSNAIRTLTYYTMLRHSAELPKYAADIVETMQRRLLKIADKYIDHIPSNAFVTVMGQSKNDFLSGSNFVAANQGILLINAYLLTGDQKYIDGAITNLDYLLGRNATGYCFITGFGTKSPQHLHNGFSSDKSTTPIPGLLVGGPGASRSASFETSYVDNDDAYGNETALYWNATMAYLVNAIEAVQYESALSKK